jgi:hypothetical protein
MEDSIMDVKPTRFVIRLLAIFAVLVLASCKRDDPAPAPPPPAAKPPIRGAAADADLRVMLAELASARACEMVRGQFVGLRAAERPGTATGVLWIRDCKITNEGTAATFRLAGQGWQWAAQSKKKAGGKFSIAQYVRFAVDVSMPGTFDIAYDRGAHVVSLWFTPTSEPQVDFTPVGDIDVDRQGTWSSVVGALGSVFASSPEELAEQDADKQGTQQFARTLADGLAATINLCTGLARFNLGRPAKGVMQPPDVGTTKRVPVELHPGGIALAGPQIAKNGMTIHAEAQQGAVRLALVCAEQAEAVAAAFVAKRPIKPHAVLGQVDVRGSTKLKIKPTDCPVVAIASPLGQQPATVAWLRMPSEIAESTGGPLIQCR